MIFLAMIGIIKSLKNKLHYKLICIIYVIGALFVKEFFNLKIMSYLEQKVNINVTFMCYSSNLEMKFASFCSNVFLLVTSF